MIRLILVATFLFLFLVGSIPLLIAEWIIGFFSKEVKSKSSLAIVLWAFRVILWLAGAKITYLGEENVPKDTAVLYVGNHRSYFDVVMTYVRVPRPTGYIAKKVMNKYILLNNWMRNLHCLFLDRDNIKQGLKTILEAVELAKEGISICIFPEGTRNREKDTFLPFHEGSFKIASKAGIPVVPMTIVNSAALFEDHLPFIKKSKVIIEYGKPIYINELDAENKKHPGEYVQGIIKETYFKNKALLENQQAQ